jgi:hypothetical protein
MSSRVRYATPRQSSTQYVVPRLDTLLSLVHLAGRMERKWAPIRDDGEWVS